MSDRLREIAEAATPGSWADPEYDDAPGDQGWYVLNGEVGMRQHAVAVTSDTWSSRAENDAKHIATFDPPTVLALLDVADAARDVHSRKPLASYLADDRRLADALARLREVASHA